MDQRLPTNCAGDGDLSQKAVGKSLQQRASFWQHIRLFLQNQRQAERNKPWSQSPNRPGKRFIRLSTSLFAVAWQMKPLRRICYKRFFSKSINREHNSEMPAAWKAGSTRLRAILSSITIVATITV